MQRGTQFSLPLPDAVTWSRPFGRSFVSNPDLPEAHQAGIAAQRLPAADVGGDRLVLDEHHYRGSAQFPMHGPGVVPMGALSDRFGARAVVLAGGALLGFGLVAASQADTVGQFQILFGMIIGVAAGSFYAPLTATAAHWFIRRRSLAVALVSTGFAVGSQREAIRARQITSEHIEADRQRLLAALAGQPVGFVQRALPMAASTAIAKVAKHAPERTLDVAMYSWRNRRFTGGRKLHSGLACTSGAIGGGRGLAQRGVGYCSAR